MMKNTYRFNDFTNSEKKIKEMVNVVDDENFDKNTKKIKDHFSNMIEVNHYLEQALQYIVDHNITIGEYYLMVANNYRNHKNNLDFEKINPFVKEKDIITLVESNNKDEATIFADALTKTVEKHLLNRFKG